MTKGAVKKSPGKLKHTPPWAGTAPNALYNGYIHMKPALTSSQARIALVVAFISLGALLSSQPAPRERVGPLPDGSFLLNSGWRLAPVGKQVPLDTFPMSSALSPDGRYLLVVCRRNGIGARREHRDVA